MKLRYQVQNRNGSALAAFAHESDAEAWARRRADSTFQTPIEVYSVHDMSRTTKVAGRLLGTLMFEFDSRRSSDAPNLDGKVTP